MNFSLKRSISDFPLITNFWVTNLFTNILLLLLFGNETVHPTTKTILIYYSSIKWLRLSNCQIVSGSAHVILSCHPTVYLQHIIMPFSLPFGTSVSNVGATAFFPVEMVKTPAVSPSINKGLINQ